MSEKTVSINGQQHDVVVEHEGSRFRAGDQEIEIVSALDDETEIRVGQQTFIVPYAISGTQVSFWFDGTSTSPRLPRRDRGERPGTAITP